MTKIRVMDEELANKIAAGEVVEKCSSIVKELVENSIDAKSKNIIVKLEDGGKKLISITDDGSGINRDEVLLAFKRHATSKIYKNDDLFFIDTLGFRGEALPSIASVSRVDVKTSTGEEGRHVVIEGGLVILDEGSDARRGTSIEVTKLFFNTPARLKYLKSEKSELASILLMLERLALSHPEISFKVESEGREALKTSGSGDLLKCIHELYGVVISSAMMKIEASNNDFDLFGYVCKPEVLKNNKNSIITMVNGRVVKNYDLTKIINDSYYNYKPDTKYPICVIKIETDPTLIDVNIHPTKQDIKIGKINSLKELLESEIKSALEQTLLIQDAVMRMAPTNTYKEELMKEVIKTSEEEFNKNAEEKVQTTIDFASLEDFPAIDTKEDNVEEEVVVNPEIKKLKLYPVGQAHGTFIIAEDDTGVYLIDQHAAAERVNYEKIKEYFKNKEINTIDMLVPITIELSSSEFIKIKDNFNYIESLGFIVEEFGINSVVFKSHPTWLKEGHEEEVIRKMVDIIISDKDRIDRMDFEERLIQTIACKMSIKANMKMSLEAMQILLDELFKCQNPYNCAHGRPSIIKFSNYELNRMFKRAMN